MNHFMSLARQESFKSEHRHKLGALIVKNNRVISKGYNQVRHCATGKQFASWNNSVCAERDACRKVDKEILKGATVYIYREGAKGEPRLARPCNHCYRMLVKFGVKQVIYTVDNFPFTKIEKL